MLVRTVIASDNSPWLKGCALGDIHVAPVSHGEGRFVCPDELLQSLINNGQIATQYVDLDGNPTMDLRYNPNGSTLAVEGILSPDGRVFGKMAHSERAGANLYKNVDRVQSFSRSSKMALRTSSRTFRNGFTPNYPDKVRCP